MLEDQTPAVVDMLTPAVIDRLLANGRQQAPVRGTDREIDFEPVAKLVDPIQGCAWLLTEMYPHLPNIAFGLCDLGLRVMELGDVDLRDLAASRRAGHAAVFREPGWASKNTLLGYARAAWENGRIAA